MSTVAVTRLIEASVDELWQVFTDLPARAAHLSTVESVDVRTAGPFGAGTRWREIRTLPDGLQVGEEYVVERVEPPTLCTVTSPGWVPTTGSPTGSPRSPWAGTAAAPRSP
ncbi:SRPBCC domain-containing protein [Plantactinospora sp. KBS50]|uniref:SRPBCC family protein n=1 Tax=Plantactinospora sp. KBS50 TaxID=2024580 RepID=UPI00268AF8F9